jgi:ATP-dependent metalloprotease
MAYAMVTSYGFSDLLGDVDYRSTYEHVSPETRRLIDNEVRRLIEEAKANARKILTERRHELDLLAKALVQYETLDKDEIVKVVKGEKLPDRLMAAPGAQIKIPEPSDDSTSTPAPPVVLPGNNNSDDPDPPSGSSVPA